MSSSLPHRLERTVAINAPRDTVFRFFADTPRWAAWWGAGSTIDARPGGPLLIIHPGGVEVRGEVVDVAPPERIVFTYGYASGSPIPPGGSRVTIRLEAEGRGTRLVLLHEFADTAARDHHAQGWRYQLSLFANVVLDELHAGAAAKVDGWFAAWSEEDEAARAERLAAIAAPDVRLRDRFSLVTGMADLLPHLAASHRFMPGFRLRRAGDVRHCQGTLLADWVAVAPDGQERARGTNVFALDADGRIESVTGFWTLGAR
jgi:uncharacterized protein YndB with AHSA1/START domain